MEDEKEVKEKRYEHIAIRPNTFQMFRNIKTKEEIKSDDSLLIKLIKCYRGEE